MILLFDKELIFNLETIINHDSPIDKDIEINLFNFVNFTTEPEPALENTLYDAVFPNLEDKNEKIFDINEPLSKEKTEQDIKDNLILEERKRIEQDFITQAEEIISNAKMKADAIISKAEQDAVNIKSNAYSKGMEDGYTAGINKAYEENKTKLEAETLDFLIKLKSSINDFEDQKARLITESINELKEISISVAEKVIHVGLKSSGEIIKKMIISATEKLKSKDWAKIYIAKCDASLLIETNSDLLKSIDHLSEHIKVIVMEDSAPGTCIIELPDQIIDASAATQIENIKGVLKGISGHGGN